MPPATQLAIYIGWLLHRTKDGILDGVLFVLPSLLLLCLLAWVNLVSGDALVVAGVRYGIKPAVVAIMLQPVHFQKSPLVGIERHVEIAVGVGAFWGTAL
ncbi:chromate transporter [Allohahella marinimesophila]|uniref:chromate transporter n=1 Tax=Allohahella marinimesophila TaxID=1054972 RepID=UPI0031DDA8A3